MAASRRKNEKTPALRPETKRGIASIVLFLFAAVSSLALIDKAGVAGLLIKESLTKTFGVALFVIPLLLFLLSISLVFSLKRSFTMLRSFGALLFFISTLGFVAIFSDNKGGAIGNLIAKPLVHFLDIGGSATLLITGILISLFIIFDVSLIDLTVRLERAFIALKNKKREPVIIDTTSTPGGILATERTPDTSSEHVEEADVSETDTSETSEEGAEGEPVPEEDVDHPEVPRPRAVTLEPWENPPLSLLERDSGKAGSGDVKAKMNIIKRTLQNFGIDVEMDDVTIGPSVTRYALKPAEGVKLSRIVGLQDNLAYMLAAHPIRIEAPIPGKSLVGIEIPNTSKATVGLGSLLSQDEYQKSPHALLAAVGKDITGTARFANLAKMPHLLIAGATGSGKSVTIHAIINSLLYKNAPEALRFIMIDPKRVELTLYNGIPHLISPVVTDAKKTIGALRWAAKEMDRRYDLLEQHSVRDIQSYQTNVYNPAIDEYKKASKEEQAAMELPPAMPYIVIIIDELADIMATFPRELEASIVRLAQMSRAVGIHLILSTQRPSVNVITGLIKANVPARIALQVASQIDSRTILDMSGAENLLGAGDMLYLSADMSKPVRLQSAFISEPEVKGTVSYLKKAGADRLMTPIDFAAELQGKDALSDGGKATMVDDGEEDELYEDAREIIMRENKASTSLLQRKLGIGYGRAARIIDLLESRGIIGPATSGSKAREVIARPGEGTGAETPEDRDVPSNLESPEENPPA